MGSAMQCRSWAIVSAEIKKNFDDCEIRTHAPEGICLAGRRLNHSAKPSLCGDSRGCARTQFNTCYKLIAGCPFRCASQENESQLALA